MDATGSSTPATDRSHRTAQDVLLTIGYEGASLDDFVATLRAAHVSVLLDVREIAASRRKGFAKTALSAALEHAGIRYVHLPDLGDPKDGREAARSGDHDGFLRIFNRHLKKPEAQRALREALELASQDRACLMCYERAPEACHRSIVATSLCTQSRFAVRHLGVRQGIAAEQGKVGQRRGSGSR